MGLSTAPASAGPLGSAFTYQGELRDAGALANGLYDFEVRLFDAGTNGGEVAPLVTLNDVPVADGRFTVPLDFGAGAFVGAERWLQLAVRPGASAAAYTIVLPRQLLRSAPESLRAATSATAPWSGLTGVPAGFADGIDNGVTSVGSGTGLTGGPITGSGTLSVDGSVVQLRVTGTCGAGTAMSAIASNGSVTCSAGGSGGVTSVASGTGLTGGPITTSGTISVASKGITTALIADQAVGLGQINTSQVQARITGSCAVGRYFRGVAADGTVLCEPLPGVFSIGVADDPAPKVGSFLALVVGNDGVPVMAHAQGQDPSFALRVTHCNDVACTGNDETSTTVDTSSPQTGVNTAIAIGADGNPVIVYRNNSTGSLWVAKCNDPACTGGDETKSEVVVKSAFAGLSIPSIAIGADTFPVIAFSDYDANTMKVAKCNDTACAGANETVTDIGVPGRAKAIRIGLDGNPVIAYELITNFALSVTKCNDPACAGNNETTTIVDDTANILATNVAMVVRSSGRPLIVHSDDTTATIRVIDCNDVACAGQNETISVLSDNGKSIAGFDTLALAIGVDGLPAIAFRNSTDNSVRFAHCADDHCNLGTATYTTLDDPGIEPRYIQIAIAGDGTPVVAYHDFNNGRIKVIKCGTRTCQ